MAELADTLDATEDDRLDQAEGLVRAYCGWHISPSRTETAVVRTAGDVLLLPTLYLTDVASVTLYDATVVDVADYEWSQNGVISQVWGGPWSWRSVTVEFTHGYDIPPPEITAVVQAIAQRAVDNPRSLTRETKGPFTDVYSQSGSNQTLALSLMDGEKAVLNAYKLPPRP